MSMHAKTDSEVTSLAPSSPTRPAYYVQSPSRDSHVTATPTTLSPDRHSSSSTRFSGSLLKTTTTSSSSRKPIADDMAGRRRRGRGKEERGPFDSIEEEGLLDDDLARGGTRRRWYVAAFVVGFFVLFSFFALVLWGASRNQKPVVTMKSILFNEFSVHAGNDNSGVATDMVTMNSTIKLIYRNTGTFFGIHVTSTPINLAYSELTLARGAIKRFYQSRKGQRLVTVTLQGSRTPLYGGGADLGTKNGIPILPVPLDLNFTVKSKAYVLGKLVKPKFHSIIHCAVIMDPKKMNVALSLKKNCTIL